MVSAKIYLPLEAFGTDLAAERLESGVFATVCDEVGALAEGLATHLAFVRFLTCKQTEPFFNKMSFETHFNWYKTLEKSLL